MFNIPRREAEGCLRLPEGGAALESVAAVGVTKPMGRDGLVAASTLGHPLGHFCSLGRSPLAQLEQQLYAGGQRTKGAATIGSGSALCQGGPPCPKPRSSLPQDLLLP